MIRPAIGEIIARHGGDDDMLEPEALHPLSHTLGFILLERERFRRIHRAKTAGSGATVSSNHESGRAAAPALPAVRALRAFADCVEAQIGDQALGRKKDGVRGQPNLDPIGLLGLVERGIDFDGGHWKNLCGNAGGILSHRHILSIQLPSTPSPNSRTRRA